MHLKTRFSHKFHDVVIVIPFLIRSFIIPICYETRKWICKHFPLKISSLFYHINWSKLFNKWILSGNSQSVSYSKQTKSVRLKSNGILAFFYPKTKSNLPYNFHFQNPEKLLEFFFLFVLCQLKYGVTLRKLVECLFKYLLFTRNSTKWTKK